MMPLPWGTWTITQDPTNKVTSSLSVSLSGLSSIHALCKPCVLTLIHIVSDFSTDDNNAKTSTVPKPSGT